MEKENEIEKNFTSLIMILLMVIILGLIFYIGYDKMMMESDRRDEPKPSVTESPSPESPVVEEEITDQNLIQSIYNVVYTDGFCCKEGMSNYYKKNKITVDELSIEEKNRIVLHHVLKEVPLGKGEYGGVKYSSEQIFQMAKKTLGKNTFFEILVDASFCYASLLTDGNYLLLELDTYQCSCVTPVVETKILKAVKSESFVKIEEMAVFPHLAQDKDGKYVFSVYANPDQTSLLKQATYQNFKDYETNHFAVNVEEFASEASRFRWTYKESDGGYAFVQIERIK